jgi:hypothetical protein
MMSMQRFLLRRLSYGVAFVAGVFVYEVFRGTPWGGDLAVAVAFHILLVGYVIADPVTRARAMERLQELEQLQGAAIAKMILIHMGFLLLVIGIERFVRFPPAGLPEGLLEGQGDRRPLLWVIASAGVIAACYFERKLLFSGGPQAKASAEPAIEFAASAVASAAGPVSLAPQRPGKPKPGAPLLPATAADHAAWVQERAAKKLVFYKPGMSPSEDFELWLRARGKSQKVRAPSEFTPKPD